VGELGDWKHCPVCAYEIRPEGGSVECPNCGFVTFAHSKPTSSAVVHDDDGRILLSRRASDPQAGKWDLPGGFVEEGEHPLDSLRRELREEAGVELKDEDLLGIWIDRYEFKRRTICTFNVYYAARIASGTPEPADDVAELRFFAPDEVPADELAFEHIEDVLSAWSARYQHA
jgi:mutator protein MutT